MSALERLLGGPLIENEQRIAQAVRNLRGVLKL